MNIQRQGATRADAAIGAAVGIAETREALSAIHDPCCAAMLWQRRPDPDFQRWIDALDPDSLPGTREILRPDAVRGTFAALCAEAGTPPGPQRDWLIDDVAMLAETFVTLVPAPFLRLRLDVVASNACRRFHVDAIAARLICTYRGTGTQYGVSIDGDDPEQISTVPTGAPVLLRGTLWPQDPPSGLVHRSPPIEGTGETRLVLVLDPIASLEEDV